VAIRLGARLGIAAERARVAAGRAAVVARQLWEEALLYMPAWGAAEEHDAEALEGPDALAEIKRLARRPLLAVVVFGLVLNVLALTIPIYMSQIYDRVLSSYSPETLVMLTVMALGLLVLFVAIDHVRVQVLSRTALKAEQAVGPALLAASVKDQLAGRPDANLPLRDMITLRNTASSPPIAALCDAPIVPFFILVSFLIHTLLGIMTLVGVLSMLGLAIANQRATAKRIETAGRSANALIYASEQQTRNAEVIEAMGLLGGLTQRWRAAQGRALGHQLASYDSGAAFQAASRYLRLALQVLTLGLGAGLVLQGEVTPGMMFAASIILSRGLQPVESAVGSWRTLAGAKSSYERIRDALMRAGRTPDAMPLPPPSGALELENVYAVLGPERRAVLRAVSLSLRPGESLGILGPSASGKSTLGRIMLGIWPAATGKVRLDGADITQWPRAALGPHIGYLPQEVELFPGTVADNIARMGMPDSDMVLAAARAAGIHELVLHLPQGYDTRIMAGGLMLSPGQRQRIGLARALYGAPRLILLDEPNANLDGEGEEALARALREAKSWGATLIVIAHRLTVLQNVETLLLLRDGLVQGLGPKEEILGRLAGRPGQIAAGTVVPMFNILQRPGPQI
jgi:PrtD family type I secretion system ABC transporter